VEKNNLVETLMRIEAKRESVASARRFLLTLVPSDPAAINLKPYVKELEAELEKLVAVALETANRARRTGPLNGDPTLNSARPDRKRSSH
jgi:hypothetical protein